MMVLTQNPTDKEKTLLVEAGRDPVWFSHNVLGVRLWVGQQEIAQSVRQHTRTVVRSCSGSGKSFTAACLVVWFLYNNYPSTVITTAPTFRQVESILWREIAARHANSRYPLSGKITSTGLELAENWFAIGLSTDEPERFQGFHNENVLVVADEGSGIPESVYTAIENPMAAGSAKELLIGNPTQSSGTYYQAFSNQNYHPIVISCFGTPNFTEFGITIDDIRNKAWQTKIGAAPLPYPSLVTPSWVAEMFEQWGIGSYMFQVYCLGNFPDAGTNNLIRLSWVEQCTGKHTLPDAVQPIILAVDVSRYGDDETVVMVGQGKKVLSVHNWGHQDTVYTTGRVARIARDNKARLIRVDSVGVGGGVADMLKAEGFTIEEVNVGRTAVDTETFFNRRAELYWLTARLLEEGKLDLPDNPKLRSQLTDIQYRYTQRGQVQMETKEEMRARGTKSPDYADSLVMLMGKSAAGGSPAIKRSGYRFGG